MGNYAKQLQKKATGMTNEGKRQDAISRLAMLEARYDKFVTDVGNDMQNLVMMVTAISQILGVEQVAEKMKQNGIEQLEHRVAQNEIRFAEAVSNGYLEIVKTVARSEEDLNNIAICGSISDSAGELKYPSKFYKEYYTWDENIRKELIDKKVGDKLTLEDGSVLTVVQIYKATGKKPEQV